MAQTPSTGVASSSQATGGFREANGSLSGSTHNGAQSSRQMQEMTPTSFKAVNVRAVSQNAARSTPPTASSAQSIGVPAVAPSGPQTARTSFNAQAISANIDGMDDSMTDIASYGTRSRNRAGNARPNYAEDQDMDFDLSSAATTKKKGSGGQAAAALNPDELKRAEDLPRSSAVNNHAAKESTPSSSGPVATMSKKRKAGGTIAHHSQTPPASTTPVPNASRKPATTVSSSMARDTNVMTFSKHRNCLNKRGELIADDGTKLAVNGKRASSSCFLCEVSAYPASNNSIDPLD